LEQFLAVGEVDPVSSPVGAFICCPTGQRPSIPMPYWWMRCGSR
jgi:hypothetical protein